MSQTTKSPGDFLREELEARRWTQADLAKILDRPLPTINRILQGKHAVLPEMAIALGQAFGNEPQIWMQREYEYRLSLASLDTGDVRKRARLYELAPIKDMQRRGWIHKTDKIDGLETELKAFFGVESLDRDPTISASARKTDASNPFNAAQRAWAFRAKQLSQTLRVNEYSDAKLGVAIKKLRRLLGWPEQSRKVASILAECGIRFVVVEPLPHTRIDGVAFWLDSNSPVIAMSMRFDRIDNFWHVLGHEMSHIRHRDDPAVDADSVIDERPSSTGDEIEDRANREAAATWIDKSELESFIDGVGPLYSRDKINQFANSLRVHPGIIIGQLQGREELRFNAFRESLVKIRDTVTAEALTDGWGHEVGI